MVRATISAPRSVAEEQEQDHHHKNDALSQVVQDGVGGVMHQIAAVEKGNHLHAGRKNMIVQLLDLRVDALQRRVRIRALPQQHDAGDHVIVVDDLSVLQMPRSRELAQPDLRPLCDDRDVFDLQRRAGLGQ